MQTGIWADGKTQKRCGWMLLVLTAAAVLAGCSSRGTPAPINHLNTNEVRQPAPIVSLSPGSGASYTVVAGDTLFSIARRHGIEVESLARLNQIDDPSQLRAGQVLRLSASSPAPAVTQPVTVAPPPPAPRAPDTTAATKPPAQPISNSAPRASDADAIRWEWPVKGRILQAFSVNTKGIDIEGKLGDPVYAAADGKVVYVGNGVRGLGNLVLIGHSGNFISAYAHNQTLLVKNGDNIKQGAKIASLGQSEASSPRLHFEIRRDRTPVNPLSYLPAR